MNHFILSDSRKCIGCQACEVACVMAHNEEQHVLTPQRFLPRITVIKAEGQRNAITCRHCEDAPCVRSCPNDAIAQSGDSVQVRQEKCIGCKSCMVACPFGVMQVVVTPQAAGLVKASAHKCDLCQGREAGPACVENCPAQALTLADDETLITLAKQRRLRSACQEVQPWQRATPLCSQPNAGAKVRQMAMTPPRGEPDKLAAEVRKSHFEEIYQPFTPQQAQQQAARCLTCGEHSICEWTCPLHNHIPQWIELVKAGNIAAAVALSHQTNCLPEITGRVCPRTGCVKAPAPCAMKAGQSPSAILSAIFPTRRWPAAGVRTFRRLSRAASGWRLSAPGRPGWPAPICWCATASSRWSSTVIRRLAVC